MNGWLLLIPFFAVRFLLPAGLNRHALQRAAYFAPMRGKERMAYYMYQISNAGLFFYLFFLNVKVSVSICFFLGVFSIWQVFSYMRLPSQLTVFPTEKVLTQMVFTGFPAIPCMWLILFALQEWPF